MRRLGLILVLSVILLTPALATNYQIGIDPINNSVYPDQSASFKLTITNFDEASQRFQVYTFDTKWILRVDPPVSTVPSRSQKTYTIYVKPKSDVSYGTEGVTIMVKHLDSKQITQQSLIIHVKDPNSFQGEYAPSVNLEALYPTEIDPRKPLDIQLNFRNRNALNLTTMMVYVSSPLFEQKYESSLGPLKEMSEDLTFELDSYQAAGEYPLEIWLTYKNETVNRLSKTLRIATIEDVREETESDSFLFKSSTTVTVTNKGNGPATAIIELPTNAIRNLFSKTEPKVERTGSNHVWNIDLASQESKSVTRTENYRLLIILIILILAGIITYYLTRSPVIAVKEAIHLHEEGEEGANELKVRLFIKNRTGSTLSEVAVIDRVPSIATYHQEEHLGTISPTKVVNSSKKGTMLKWDLDLLEPYEERILSYRLASKLKIVGKMRLPPAKVQFSTKSGKERVTYTRIVSYDE